MNKFIGFLILALLMASPLAHATYAPDGEDTYEVTTIASIPACTAARDRQIIVVNDAASATDCTTGSGTTTNICVCDGSATTNVDV